MTTAHLAAKPLLIYNLYIYWICGHQHKLATWHSSAAFEPYSHWPHPSLTIFSAWGDNDRAPCCEASPMSCVVYHLHWMYPAWGDDDRAPRCEASAYIYIYIFIYTLVMWTTSTCLATLQSWAAFEPYIHWPHSSLTITGRVRASHSLAASEPKNMDS